MESSLSLQIHNGASVELSKIPLVTSAEFQEFLMTRLSEGERLASYFGNPQNKNGVIKLFSVLANGQTGLLSVLSTEIKDRYPSISNECPQAIPFEREIAEQWGIAPMGKPGDDYPWLKPLRFHHSYQTGKEAWNRSTGSKPMAGVMNFYQVTGPEAHEVAVGPVHAGVIEPGHFRFQCHGEEVLNLEISLGYQHRGVEPALVGGPNNRTLHYMETLSGDTSIGHSTAYAQAVEALASCKIPVRGEAIRAIALELERLANHTGDLGALTSDVGYLPTASYAGRLRGDFLNMTALICGSRLGRGLVRPGGVRFDVEPARGLQILDSLSDALKDLTEAAKLLWNTPSVLSRFEGIGGLSKEFCEKLGIVGPSARACGLDRDVRFEFPAGFFRYAQIPVSTWHTGDVFSRAYLRWLEIQRSAVFIRDRIRTLPDGPVRTEMGPHQSNRLVVSLVEGWRGEICHVGITNSQGRFSRYKIVDPSFHNWPGLALAMRGGQISDFPLINKSFNLSYAGHDL